MDFLLSKMLENGNFKNHDKYCINLKFIYNKVFLLLSFLSNGIQNKLANYIKTMFAKDENLPDVKE